MLAGIERRTQGSRCYVFIILVYACLMKFML